MMKGAIEYLLSDEAKGLRKHFVFKIVPMLNPDGVRYGNYRTSLLGVDLNRRWDNPHKMLHPTIYYTKRLIQSFQEDRELIACVDMHGHSAKKNVFAYGCCVKSKDFEGRKANVMIKFLPYTLSTHNRNFSFKDCKFRLEKSKEKTQRIVLFKEFGILNAYTVEASFYGPSSSAYLENRSPREGEESSDCHFETSHLEGVGRDLCRHFNSFVNPQVFRKKLEFVEKALKKRAAKLLKPQLEAQHTHSDEVDQTLGILAFNGPITGASLGPGSIRGPDAEEDLEEIEEFKLHNLLDQIEESKTFAELELYDDLSDSGGSDSCITDNEQPPPKPRIRHKSKLRMQANPSSMKESSSLQKHNLKLRARRLISPSNYIRNRPSITEDNGVVVKQTHLRFILEQHLSQMSKVRTLINKTKVPTKERSRQLLQTTSQDYSFQEPKTGLRNASFAQRRRPEFEPADSFVVSSICSVKGKPTVIWKSPNATDDSCGGNGVVM